MFFKSKQPRLPYPNGRAWEIDAARGLAVILMMIYHLLYDLRMYASSWQYQNEAFVSVYLWVRNFLGNSTVHHLHYWLIIYLFFFVSGISQSFSRSSFKRGIIVALCALVVTVTFSFLEMRIVFGALHCLSLSMILYAGLNKFVPQKYAQLALGVVLTVMGLLILPYTAWMSFPAEYDNICRVLGFAPDGLLTVLGIPIGSHSDYSALLPSFGIFLIGSFVGKTLYKERKTRLPFYHPVFLPLCFCGKNALLLYLAHQPICYGIFFLVDILVF